MSTIEHEFIRGRSDFFSVLEELLHAFGRRVEETPDDPLDRAIYRQLEAMARWTGQGRQPTKDERRSVIMDRQIAREADPQDAAEQELYEKAGELAFYFKHWLDDRAWRALDDEDPATFFPDA